VDCCCYVAVVVAIETCQYSVVVVQFVVIMNVEKKMQNERIISRGFLKYGSNPTKVIDAFLLKQPGLNK
jgi:hypothetical protein